VSFHGKCATPPLLVSETRRCQPKTTPTNSPALCAPQTGRPPTPGSIMPVRRTTNRVHYLHPRHSQEVAPRVASGRGSEVRFLLNEQARRGEEPPMPAQEPPNLSQPADQPQEAAAQPANPFLVVGVGASAGGLEAFREMLEHLPADSG